MILLKIEKAEGAPGDLGLPLCMTFLVLNGRESRSYLREQFLVAIAWAR
jgi:hypothetical protein